MRRAIVLLITLIFLAGCSSYEVVPITQNSQEVVTQTNAQAQEIAQTDTQTQTSAQTTQSATDRVTQTTTSSKYPGQCPDQGFMEDDNSYCADICMVGKSDSQANQNNCQNICDKVSYYDSTEKFQEYIQKNKCSKCGQGC